MPRPTLQKNPGMLPTSHPIKALFSASRSVTFSVKYAIQANIVIGVASLNCAGHGVCKILAHHERAEASCRQALASVQVDGNGRLRMLFPRDKACKCLLKSQFGKEYFLVEEPFYLPPWLCRQLQMAQCRIAPGQYAMKKTSSFFTVNFF